MDGVGRGGTKRRTPAVALALALLVATAVAIVAPLPSATPAGAAPLGSVHIRASAAWNLRAVAGAPDGTVWFTDWAQGIGRRLPDGRFQAFPTIDRFTGGTAIAVAPDGSAWATQESGWGVIQSDWSVIHHIGADGSHQIYNPPDFGRAFDLTIGPDGATWYTSNCGMAYTTCHAGIGRIGGDGTLTLFTDAAVVDPTGIVAGPDGALWFGLAGACSGCAAGLGRITTDGTITTYTAPGVTGVFDVTVGGDGRLWFTVDGDCTWSFDARQRLSCPAPAATAVGAATTAGAMQLFAQPGWYNPTTIVTRADGSMLVVDRDVKAVQTDGSSTVALPDPSPPVGSPKWYEAATVAPDGTPWLVQYMPVGIGWADGSVLTRLEPDGTTTALPDPTLHLPEAMAAGRHGDVWFVNANGGAFPSGVQPPSIGRTTGDHTTTTFVPPLPVAPFELAVDTEGRPWFSFTPNCCPMTPGTVSGVGRVEPDGTMTLFSDPALDGIRNLTFGSDGALWATRDNPNLVPALVRVDDKGHVTVRTWPGLTAPDGLASGPDGALWLTVGDPGSTARHLVRLPPTGEPQTVAVGAAGFTPSRLVFTRDGGLWATSPEALTHLTLDGTVLDRWPVFDPFGNIAAGADGRLWYLLSVPDMNSGTFHHSDLYSVAPGDAAPTPHVELDGDFGGMAAGPDGDVWFSDTWTQMIVSVGTGVEPPSAPSGVVAAPGLVDGAVDVSWTASASDGGRPITSYQVTARPETGLAPAFTGFAGDPADSCTVTPPTTSCTLADLTAGIGYFFTVTATNAGGLSNATSSAGIVTPPRRPGAGFTPVTPFRAGDTRPGSNIGFTGGPIAGGTSKVLPVAGIDDVPPSARAVVATVTVTNPTAASYLTVYPSGAPAPGTANLLFAPGQTVAQSVTVPVGTDGTASFFNQLGDVDLVVDITGYFDDGTAPTGRFNPTAPVRVLDSRTSPPPGTPAAAAPRPGQWNGQPLGPDETRSLSLAGAVPATATAAVVNLTVTAGSDPSYLQALPGGATRAQTATALFAPGQTITTLTTVGLGPDQTIDLYNQQGNVHVVADLVGWYDPTTGDLFHPITPRRLHDTRTTNPLGPGEPRTLPATYDDTGIPALPADATALAGTLTATGGTDPSYLTAGPTPLPNPPGTANLLFAAGQTIPNAITTGLSPTHTLDLFNQTGTVHAILDLTSYWSAT